MKYLLLLLSLCGTCFAAQAQSFILDSTTITISTAIDSSRITAPWDIEWAYDHRLWMTDANRIRAWDPASGTIKTLFHFPKGYGLGLAIPTGPSSSGPTYIYAIFDTTHYYASGNYCRLYRFEYDATADTLINPVVLLGYKHIGEHAGGRVLIGQDGKIWLNTADFTFASDTPGGTVGRVLRVNPDGTIPADNIKGDYTYSTGHRNPQGMVQLPDGTIFCTEHSGPTTHDEVNLISAGGQYGWPALQGYSNCTGMVPDSCSSPAFTASHRAPVYAGSMTPSGIDYYKHPAIPEWHNCLLVGTLHQPDSCLTVLQLNTEQDAVLNRRNYLKKNSGGINDFKRTRDIAVAPDGSIYCIVHDRSYTNTGSTLINKGTKILRLINEAYIPSGISLVPFAQEKVYPNPASEILIIELRGQITRSKPFQLINLLGQEVKAGTLTHQQTRIDVSDLPSGTYYFISGKAEVLRQKVTIIR